MIRFTILLILSVLLLGCGLWPKTEKPVSFNDNSWLQPFHVPPKLINNQPPKYPEQAKQKKLEGKVYVKILVGIDGLVKGALVLYSSDPIFKKAALTTVKDFRFTPAKLNDRLVQAPTVITVWFRLNEHAP